MKKNFLTGFAILLPVVLTAMIAIFFINLLTAPFLGLVSEIFLRAHFLSNSQLIHTFSKILILIFLASSTFLIGFLTHHLFADYFFRAFDRIIQNIPIINKIYKAFQEVMYTLFESNQINFSKVVLVPFPHANCYCIGFITKEFLAKETIDNSSSTVSVYIPGTPNPFVGFNFLYQQNEIILLDIKVNEALKFIISCGVGGNIDKWAKF